LQIINDGNVGILVTPPAWSGFKALNIYGSSISASAPSDAIILSRNWYYDGSERYFGNGSAQRLELTINGFYFQTAGVNSSGAGAALTWNTQMTLAPSGSLCLGSGSPRTAATGGNRTLDVRGGIYFGSTNQESTCINNDDSMIFNIDANNDGTGNFFRFATNTTGETGGTELMRIIDNGRVGIGIPNPEGALHVAVAGLDDQLVLGSTAVNRDTAMLMYSGANKAEVLRYQSSVRLVVGASANIGYVDTVPGGTQALRVRSNGLVTLGTENTTDGRLQIRGSGVADTTTTYGVILDRGTKIAWTNTGNNSTGEYIYSQQSAPYGVTIHSGANDAIACPNTGDVYINHQGGNLLVGTTTSTGAKLEVNGSIRTGTLDTGYVSGFWKLGRAVIGTQPGETHQIIVEINGQLYVIGAALL
jgi:hypothetical protein